MAKMTKKKSSTRGKTPAKSSKPKAAKSSKTARAAKKPAKKFSVKAPKRGKGGGALAPRQSKAMSSARRSKPSRSSTVKPMMLPENPEARALAKKVAEWASEKKATDIVILDVRGKSSYADYVVVASGDSDRQVAAIAEHIEGKLKQDENLRPIGIEGREIGQWVLLDYGEVVAHFFQADARSFYDLEGLWSDAPREAVA